jgi:hypothetical protein
MPTESDTGKPVAKTKGQIEAEFKRRFKYGLQVSEGLKGEAADDDSTAAESGK